MVLLAQILPVDRDLGDAEPLAPGLVVAVGPVRHDAEAPRSRLAHAVGGGDNRVLSDDRCAAVAAISACGQLGNERPVGRVGNFASHDPLVTRPSARIRAEAREARSEKTNSRGEAHAHLP